MQAPRLLISGLSLALSVAWTHASQAQSAGAPDSAPSFASDLFQLGQVIANRPDITGLPAGASTTMVWRCMYSPSRSGTPAHNRFFWYESEPAWLAALPADAAIRRMVEGVIDQCPLSSNLTAAQIAAAAAPTRATTSAPATAAAPAAVPAKQPFDFTAKGLEYERDVLHLYRGEFSQVGLARTSVQFGELFSGYLRAYGQRCAASLPPNKVELTRSVCSREQVVENGLGQRVSAPTCIEEKQTGTGIFADPKLHAAREALGRVTNRQGVPPGFEIGPGLAAATTSLALETRRINADMQSLVQLNGCATQAIQRFETNLVAFSQGKPGIVAPATSSPAKRSPATVVDANFTRLLEDLISEQSQTWATNRFVAGSVTQVWVQGRDASGRPSMVSANYMSRGLLGGQPGSVRLDLTDGEPDCLYFFDAPTTCRKASRRIVNAYLEGAYK